MSQTTSRPFTARDLGRRSALGFRVEPSAEERARIAEDLGATAIRKLVFEGELAPLGRHDWRLEARLGATAVQPCVVTLAPVTTRIDEVVRRIFRAELREPPPGSETEMPADTDEEPLGATVDPAAVMVEALALALPDFPRAPGVEAPSEAAGEGEAGPEDRPNPFAVLSQLKRED